VIDPLRNAPLAANESSARWPSVDPQTAARSLAPGEVHVWWMALDLPADLLVRLEPWLDYGERARASRFHFDPHRRRFVAAHGQMRALLGAYSGLAPPAVQFAAGANGKPALVPLPGVDARRPQPIEFNLSHSRHEGLLAVARGAVVGADIEVQHAPSDLDELARRHFTAGELHDLQRLPPEQRLDGFFAGWTRKEAYVKALGAGLTVPLDGFDVALHPDEPAALRSIGDSAAAAAEWTLWAERPTATSWAAVAVRHRQARVRTFVLPIAALGGP